MQLIKVMDKQEMDDELVPPSPVLPRLDRLDRLLQLLEEKHNFSRRHSSNPVGQKETKPEDDQCKTLSSALEEVQHKGTLMERLTILENRVLQLSLEMDEENTSKSGSSTVPSTEKLYQNLKSSSGSGRTDEVTIDQKNEVMTMPGRDSPVEVLDQDSNTSSAAAQEIGDEDGRRRTKKGYRKWIGWFHLGCN